MFCKKCGREIKDGVKFCNYCGEKITPRAESASHNPQQEYADEEYGMTEVLDGFAMQEAPAKTESVDVYSSSQQINPAPKMNGYQPNIPNNQSFNKPVNRAMLNAPQNYMQPPVAPPQAPASAPADQEPYKPAYKPISAWGYFGYNLLFAIPLVGFILLIVFSLSNENINRRNYARSFWCFLVIALVLALIFVVLGLVTGGALFNELEYMF